jgi:hypothetical protein
MELPRGWRRGGAVFVGVLMSFYDLLVLLTTSNDKFKDSCNCGNMYRFLSRATLIVSHAML